MLTFQGLSVHMRYLHKAKGRHTFNYRRLVPSDLKEHYDGREIIRSLQTSSETLAIRECARVNRLVEAEFQRLRSGLPKEGGEGSLGLGLRLLSRFGIHAQDYGMDERDAQGDLAAFEAHLEETFAHVLSDEDFDALKRKPLPSHFAQLPKAEKAAVELMRGELSLKASEYPAEYVRLKDKKGDKKFRNDADLAVHFLLEVLPDKAPGEYRRQEANELIRHHLESGLTTGTVKKRLAILRAMFNLVARELEIKDAMNHTFSGLHIPGEGDDKKDRRDFSYDQLQLLRAIERKRKKEIVWLMHLIMDTGLRVNECCGLKVVDVVLDDQYPHLRVHKNPFRRLKTKSSQRYVPLVGAALQAALEAVEAAKTEWLFALYVDEVSGKTKSTSASNAINKRIRAVLGNGSPSTHCFRHAMQTRLREVSCPEHLRNEMGGWSKSVSESYGSTADLMNKTKYLKQTVSAKYRVM